MSLTTTPTAKRLALYGAGAVLLLAAAYIVSVVLMRHPDLPEGLIQANGRIEGDHITIASKVPGRIVEMRVQEGDAVVAGQVVAVLDVDQARSRVQQASAAVAVLEAQVEAARLALAVLRQEVPLAVAQSQEALQSARAVANKASAAVNQAGRDAKRFRELAAQGTVGQQRAEQSDLAATAARADQDVAAHAVAQAREQVSQARLGPARVRAREAELQALAAQRDQAKATLAEAESVLSDMTIKAPSPGIVSARIRQAGEVIAPGAPVIDLVDLDRLYLKVYVPEALIGQVRLNLPARIHVDALPTTPIEARVTFISPRAEFTPKEVQTADERVKLTYGVKLQIDKNPEHRLTPGLPADAVIRWRDGVEWVKPKW